MCFFFCLVFAMSLCASVYMCFVVTCWERADLLAVVCDVKLCIKFYHFPFGILGQVWYLNVSIPDLCTLTYFVTLVSPFNSICTIATNKQSKIVSMIRNYHNHTLQTNHLHREEETQNTNSHKAPGRQLKYSNQLSLPHQYDS